MNDRLKIVHEGLDNLEQDVKLAQARNHPREAKQEDLARLSAEAVQASYTSMAKAVEGLRGPILDRAVKLEEALKGCNEALKMIEEFVGKINDTGHLVAAQIDEANALSAEVKKMVTDYIVKVK